MAMAITLNKLLASKILAPSLRPMTVRGFKSTGFDNHQSEKSHIVEIDAHNRKSIGAYVPKCFLNGVYSFTDVIFPRWSPTKKLEYLLNRMDIGDDGRGRWDVKEYVDVLCMIRHVYATPEEKAGVRVDLHMETTPKDIGLGCDVSLFRKPRIRPELNNPSATLFIERKPHVESDNSFQVSVRLPAKVF